MAAGSTQERINRGIALALAGPSSAAAALADGGDATAPAAPAAAALQKRADGLSPLPPKVPDIVKARQASEGGDGRKVAGAGVGLLAAFVEPPRNPEDNFFSEADGQRQFESTVQGQLQKLESEMCFLCDWFSEPWPLENKDRSSTCSFLQGMPLKVELEWPTGLPPKESVLVFGDRGGFCRRFLEKAPQFRVATVKYVEKNPWEIGPEDIKELLQSQKWDLVVYGFGIDFPESNSVGDIMAHLDDVSKVYLELGKLVQSVRKSCKRLACITREVFAEDPKKHKKVGVRMATASTLWGMTNCLRVELEEIPIQYIDIELKPEESCIAQVASDLFCSETFGKNTLRILNGGRYVMRQMCSRGYQVEKREFEVPSEGIIAVTGGNGSLAQVFVKHLLDQAERKNIENRDLPPVRFQLKLLSRSALVRDRERLAWMDVVHKAAKLGIDVEHVKCDVTQQESIEQFVADCTPNLTGVIHTAGILQDAMLQNQTWEKMETTLGCKSRAALYLHDALEQHQNPGLEFFWAFSTNSVYGNTGQVNYAAANFYLDGLMRHRCAMGKPGVAMQWGAWGEAGMAAAMSDAMKQGIAMSHMPFFSNQEGFAGMHAGLSTGASSICIEKFNPPLLVGMKAQADSSAQYYDRNFTCEFCPTPPPKAKPVKSKDMYDIYRMYRILAGATAEETRTSGMVWQAYTQPLQQKVDAEEDEPLW